MTTPFGGLFSDPFETPEAQTGSMYYVGARYNFNDDKTKIGLECNQGSEYWFNFAPAQDDIIAPKTSTRGAVWEAYLTHRIAKQFILKLDYITTTTTTPARAGTWARPRNWTTSPPILGFPTYRRPTSSRWA